MVVPLKSDGGDYQNLTLEYPVAADEPVIEPEGGYTFHTVDYGDDIYMVKL